MHLLLFVQLSKFYLSGDFQVPEDKTRPVVVVKNKIILEANFLAMKLGVRVGNQLSEAKALLAERGIYQEWKEEKYVQAHKKWLSICSEFTDGVESISQNEAFLDFSAHKNFEPLLLLLKEKLLENNWDIEFGLANSRWLAQLASSIKAPIASSLYTPKRFLAPLPVSCLPMPTEIINRLQWLGYSTIDEVSQIPISALRKQFGDEAYNLKEACFGGGNSKIQANFPQPSIYAHYWFEAPPDNEQILHYGFDFIAEELARQLEKQDICGRSVRLRLKRENHPDLLRERDFTQPITNKKQILTALNALLHSESFPEIIGLGGALFDLNPQNRVQLNLDQQPRDENRVARSEQVLKALQCTFGSNSISLGSHTSKRAEFMRSFKNAVRWK